MKRILATSTKVRTGYCRAPGAASWAGVCVASCMFSLVSASVAAEDEPTASKTSFSADIAVGGEYDSNVSVEEVDAAWDAKAYVLTNTHGNALRQVNTTYLPCI